MYVWSDNHSKSQTSLQIQVLSSFSLKIDCKIHENVKNAIFIFCAIKIEIHAYKYINLKHLQMIDI